MNAPHFNRNSCVARGFKHPAAHGAMQHGCGSVIKWAGDQRSATNDANVGVRAFTHQAVANQDALFGTRTLCFNQCQDVSSERNGLDFAAMPAHVRTNNGAQCFRCVELCKRCTA